MLRELLPGNFNWVLKCFLSFDNIFSRFFWPEADLIGVPFCLLLWYHRSEDLYNRIFMWKELNVRPATRTDACVFSASLLLLKWKWLCCGAYGLGNAAQLQLFCRQQGENIPLATRECTELRLDFQESVWRLWSCGMSLRISLIPFLFTAVFLKFAFW